MTAAAVLYDLAVAGVTIAAQGDRLRFWPQSAVGPNLLAQLREHKAELLRLIRGDGDTATEPQARPEIPGDDPLFPPDLQPVPIDAEPDDGPGLQWDDLQDAAEIPSCPTCPRLMTWQDALGRWRCPSCDPPDRSRRLADRVDRLRHLAAVRATVTLPVAVGGGSSQAITTDAPNGNSHISRQTLSTQPDSDPRILADPVTMCPRCESARLLPELRAITGGLCWNCFTERSLQAHD